MRDEVISLVFIEDNDLALFWNEVQTILYEIVDGLIKKEIEQKVKSVNRPSFVIIIKFTKGNDLSIPISSIAMIEHFRETILDIRYKEVGCVDDSYEVYCFLGKENNIKEELSLAANKRKGSVILINDDNYKKSKKILDQESNGKITFSINVYSDCRIFTSLFNRSNFGHIIINKKLHDALCYSDIIDLECQQTGKLKNTQVVSKSITKILFHAQVSNGYIKETDQYLPDKSFYYMRKFLEEENKEISLSDYAINSWLNAFIYSPVSCFSYGEEDGIHASLFDINKNIKKYLPFIDFYKDKENENLFKRLSDVINTIKNADIVVLLINRPYLESFYAMDEIHDLFIRYKNDDTICLIPFVRDDVRDVIFRNEGLCDIKQKWVGYMNSDSLTQEQKEKVPSIVENFDEIIEFIRGTYNHLSEKSHYENNFRSMAWVIYRHLSDNAICDVYDNVRDYNLFPKL